MQSAINSCQREREVLLALPSNFASKGYDPKQCAREHIISCKLIRKEIIKNETTNIHTILLCQYLDIRLCNITIKTKIMIHARTTIAIRKLALRQPAMPQVVMQFH